MEDTYNFPFSLYILCSLCFNSISVSLNSLPTRAFQIFIFKVVFIKGIISNLALLSFFALMCSKDFVVAITLLMPSSIFLSLNSTFTMPFCSTVKFQYGKISYLKTINLLDPSHLPSHRISGHVLDAKTPWKNCLRSLSHSLLNC